MARAEGDDANECVIFIFATVSLMKSLNNTTIQLPTSCAENGNRSS